MGFYHSGGSALWRINIVVVACVYGSGRVSGTDCDRRYTTDATRRRRRRVGVSIDGPEMAADVR